ncbi:regulatory protein, luxR family [Arboricoccus pini]|uniref:Regulatory protein, luxR family n=1 Tax=Arboricoccus pini TaxID=1963835 RepID=A0A212RG11_9PROT|nr:helix-turn-helix transcriptional regulator [Arboricoccus pini]SNB71189.1 regulatory protein, luxR family [Arboricoccus pini]
MSSQAYLSQMPAGFGNGMARVLACIGHDDFYETVINAVAPLIPCDFWIMARYETAAKPRIISESGMAPGAKSAYTKTLWHLDPLMRTVPNDARRAVSLRTLCANLPLDGAYARYLDLDLRIADELALLLPLNEQSFLALCLDRQSGTFAPEELWLASELLEILLEMHRQHVIRLLEREVAAMTSQPGDPHSEFLVLTGEGAILHQSPGWSTAVRQAFETETLPTSLPRGDGYVLPAKAGWHVLQAPLDGSSVIRDGARLFVLRRTLEDLQVRFNRLVHRYRLTARQRQIVQLCYEGHHNASIARRLGISIGGVKNHKMRIYDKLDITSERELLSTILTSH